MLDTTERRGHLNRKVEACVAQNVFEKMPDVAVSEVGIDIQHLVSSSLAVVFSSFSWLGT